MLPDGQELTGGHLQIPLCCKQAIFGISYPLIHRRGDTLFQALHPPMLPQQTIAYTLLKPIRKVVQAFRHPVHASNQVFGSCSRSLYPGMGNHIQNRIIPLVTDACDDGQRELGNICRQCVGIETRQVGSRPSSTNNHHHIELLHSFVNGIESGNDTLLHPLALHDSRKEFGAETISPGIVRQLIAEVAIASRRSRGNHRHPLGQHRHLQLLVQINNPLYFQLPEDFLALPLHVAHRISGIDVEHSERIAIEFVKLH